MSDVPQGDGWWQASDGRWYAPELHPDANRETPLTGADATPAESSAFPQVTQPGSDNIFGGTPSNVFPSAPSTEAPSPETFSSPPLPDAATDQVFGVQRTPQQASSPARYQDVQYPQAVAENSKSKVLAGLLGVFLGWLGVHRFYLGYKRLGAVMFALGVVCVTVGHPLLPIPIIWGLVEGILVFANVIKRDAYGNPLK